MRVTQRSYTDEFRTDAVAMCRRGNRSITQVAADLGVNHWTLRDWCRKDLLMKRSNKKRDSASAAAGAVETVEEKVKRLEKQVARLEREKAQLEMDREILKKAAAFFAKESE